MEQKQEGGGVGGGARATEHDHTVETSDASKKRPRKKNKKKRPSPEDEGEDGEKRPKMEEGKKEKVSRARPNVFTALQVTNPAIHASLRQIQEAALESDPALKEFLVSTTKAHVTLHAFYVKEDDDLPLVQAAMERAAARWRDEEEEGPLELHFQGLDTFGGGKVVFAKVNNVSPALDALYGHVTKEISDLQLDGVKLQRSFQPHLTVMKLSRAKTAKGRKRKKIEEEHYSSFRDLDLGTQSCGSLQLLSMLKPADPETGYYAKLAEVPLLGKSLPLESEDHTTCCLPKLPKYQHNRADAAALARKEKDVVRRTFRERIAEIFARRRMRGRFLTPTTALVACSVIAVATHFALSRWRYQTH